MALEDITRKAVLQAIKEFDKLGRDEFLRRHWYGKATRYYLMFKGRYYDAKAILGVAHGFAGAELPPLRHWELGGPNWRVSPTLRRLGFEVRRVEGGVLP